MTLPLLPLDVFLLIVEAHDSTSDNRPVAIPPRHATTRSLLSLSLVCRAAYPVAMRILFSRCLYIDSGPRLAALLNCVRQIGTRDRSGTTSPSAQIFARAQSLYLAPFPPDTIDFPSIAADVHDLLISLAPSLRTLVIDMPLRTLRPEDDHAQIRPILRQAFSQLTSLESFCSVRDELYLDCEPSVAGASDSETPVWSLWSRLQVLALYNLELDSNCWSYLKQLTALRSLVATRADGIRDIDVNKAWQDSDGPLQRLNMYLVNTWEDHHPPRGSIGWNENDPVAVYEILVPISYYGDEDPTTTCQNWEKNVAMRRELESQDGKRLLQPQAMLPS